MQLLNIRFGFICRTTHTNETGQNPIILRVIFRKERRDLFTGIYCTKEDWDSSNGIVLKTNKAYKAINDNLKHIHQKAAHAFDELKFSGTVFTLDDLINKIKGKERRPELLIDYLQDALVEVKKRLNVDISKGTYFKYRKSLHHVIDFVKSEYKAGNYPMAKVDKKFLEKYFYFMRSERNISHNSVIKYIQSFRSLIYPAINAGIIKQNPFLDLRMKPKPVYKEILSQEEVNQLSEVNLPGKDLQRVRDIFIFACYTGLAYTDIKQLKSENIVLDNDHSLYIRKPRQKTGQESIIPLLPPAIRILKKYSLTGNLRDLGWYVSSNQKMNKRLKVIAEHAGIHKDLHMHLARHTFATTITLSNGIPLETVSSMLGHASIKQTQHYAKIVANKVKKDMEKLNEVYS